MPREWDDCPDCGYSPGSGDDGLCASCKADQEERLAMAELVERLGGAGGRLVCKVEVVSCDYATNQQELTLECLSRPGLVLKLEMSGAVDAHELGEEVIVEVVNFP